VRRPPDKRRRSTSCSNVRGRVGFRVTSSRPQRMKTLDDIQRLERSRLRARLMARLQQGDADACQELFDSIGPSLTYFLRRRLADPQELEDVYQEVFMAIFEARHTYEPGRPFEPWLFAIARNIAVDYSRRRWRRAHWEELVAEPPEQPAETPLTAAPELSAALAELPPDQREAFSMLKLDGLSVEAAAARAGVSVGALKVRAHRAYKSLKRLIAR
jgi:RNA polymerase sigma-70 factor, ECF subfamily